MQTQVNSIISFVNLIKTLPITNTLFVLKSLTFEHIYSSVASRTNFFPVDEKSMQKNPRLRPVLLKSVARQISAFRTGQGRF